MQKGHKAEREWEKNNESSERQERFSGNVFQENKESNITQRRRAYLEARMGLKMS